ncbi:hypothetical protein ACFSHT_07255 [Paraburkholderia silviterrae]|uniref:Uncharacterized protein n=1 Tax=Paraburkholderia silviterrae TaxID=2528715 RepID=A0A4R5MCK4_9BURK|nr:hypothetical protein [Paraburkholderia silviterrae]TDG24686.1 hypothetical protein EYW47_09050 [Paraburkholderia silviterrae]
MTGTAHTWTLSKTEAVKGCHLLQIAIADAGFLTLNQGDAANFCRRKARTAVHRALQATRGVHPVIVTDSIAPHAKKAGNVSLQIGWGGVFASLKRRCPVHRPGIVEIARQGDEQRRYPTFT